MNIIQVANVRWHNATAWYALRLAKLLQDAGHNSLVLTIRDSEALKEALKLGLNVKCYDFNSKNPFKLTALLRDLAGLVAEFKPDIVNCHRGESFFIWGILRGGNNSFGLVRTRGDRRPPRNTALNRRLHGVVADALVATNTEMARIFHEQLGVPRARIWFIPGGVDAGRFSFDPFGRERVRAEFALGPDEPVLGLLGRFDLVKGQLETIKAINILRRKGIRARLMLLGFPTDTSLEQVREWLCEHNLEDSVITGHRPDLPACISAVDIGILASLGSEAIARAALEIMSCGRPLLSTRVGVMPDLLEEEAMVPPGDPQALAALMEKALADREWLDLRRAAQQKAMTQLTDEVFLRHTLAMYDNALASLRTPA